MSTRTKSRAELLVNLIADELREAHTYREREIGAIKMLAIRASPPHEIFGALTQLAHNIQMSADRVLTMAHGYADRELRGEEQPR